MEINAKTDYVDIVNKIIAPIRSALVRGGARPSYGSTAAWYENASADMESFARPLWALVPLWRGGGGDEELKLLYRRGIISGTDPKNSEYWGTTGDYDQRYVEMAALAYAVLFTPEIVWDPLSDDEKINFKTWLWQINTHEVCDCNWIFFRVLVNIALKAVGERYSQEKLRADLARLDSYYIGNGWYMDGPAHQKDYYISMAFHFYSLIYSCFENDEYSVKFKERALLFAKDYIYWFADGGDAVPYGRSLTYRFAQGAFWSACLLAGVMPFDISIIKGIISRHLEFWSNAPILDSGGVLTIGYRYPDLQMAEHYNAPGSPYWGLKIFAFLALADNDEFWNASAADMPKLSDKRLMREADMIVCREQGEVFAYIAGTLDSVSCGHGRTIEKYLKFVYSTAFGFNVRYSADSLFEAAPDNMLAFDVGGVICLRRYNYSFELNENGIAINWSPLKGIRVRTEITPDGASHLRRHIIESDYDCIAYDCGYAINSADGENCRIYSDKGIACAQNVSACCELRSETGEGASFFAAPNTNLLHPKTAIPAMKYRINRGRTEISTVVDVKF